MFCLLADAPGSTRKISTRCLSREDEIEAHSRIAVRYKAAGATMIDLGGSMP